jgi:hypothetical protein
MRNRTAIRKRGALLIAAAARGYVLFRPIPAPALTDKDLLIAADFRNTTGDTVFDANAPGPVAGVSAEARRAARSGNDQIVGSVKSVRAGTAHADQGGGRPGAAAVRQATKLDPGFTMAWSYADVSVARDQVAALSSAPWNTPRTSTVPSAVGGSI